jgi:hypothetical protein
MTQALYVHINNKRKKKEKEKGEDHGLLGDLPDPN